MKIGLMVVGWLALVLAVIGFFTPLLPHTPFLLLASYCFARSDKRMHDWLLNNRLFGAHLRNYQQGRGIPLRGKCFILLFMWASLAYSMSTVDLPVLRLMLAVIGLGVSFFLLRYVPTMRKDN